MNQALRDHVTSAKFVLTLGPTHIANLVQIERRLRHNKTLEEEIKAGTFLKNDPPEGHPLRRTFRLPGFPGLVARGLVTHRMPTDHKWRPSDIWTITPAGWAVITLLVEAGIWQEYSDALPAIPAAEEKPTARRRRAA